MKVLECCAYATGGVRTHLCDLVVEMETAGHEVVLVVPKVVGRHYLQNRDLENGNATLYPVDNILGLYKQIKMLSKEVELIHAHGLRAGGMAVLACIRRRNKARPKIVVTLHNTVVNARPGLVGWVKTKCAQFLAKLCAKADLVLAVSQDVADMMHKYQASRVELAIVPGPRDFTVDNLTDLEKTQLIKELAALSKIEYNTTHPLHFVLTVARLAPQKGINLLLAVSENFKNHNSKELAEKFADESANEVVKPRVQFLVAGDGPMRVHLEKEIEARHLPVTLLGYRQDLMNLLQVADVGLSTAVWEGQPIWLREALNCELPIVVTDVGGCREVVGDAAIITAQDSTEITQALYQLITNPEQFSELKAKACAVSDKAPNYAQVVAQVQSVFIEV